MITVSQTYFGHAFGADFTLPLPLGLFIYAGIASVLLSFMTLVLLYDSKSEIKELRMFALPVKAWRILGKWLSFIFLLLTIVTGYFGSQDPTDNFSVTFLWVIFLIGFTYATVIFGNIWKFINPFKTIVEIGERVAGRKVLPVLPYPKSLRYYPAVLTYVAIISLELVFDDFATTPKNTSLLLAIYLIATIIGAVVFGKKQWFQYADFFSVYFRLIAKLSSIVHTTKGIGVRKPFSGLLGASRKSAGLLLFILFMLASTSFDGFTETKQFAQIKELLPGFITNTPYAYDMLMLLLSPLLFCGLYIAFMALTKLVIRLDHSVRDLCYAFTLSLIPIAIGYNIAHYLSYLLVTGQGIIKLLSDPFGFGWDIFGTAGYATNTNLLSAHTTWYVQVGAIITGHVVAVYVAHKIAHVVFRSQRQATLSQLPLVALMVLYTTASLWIIAQPVYIAQEKAQFERKKQQEFLQVLREPPVPMPPR